MPAQCAETSPRLLRAEPLPQLRRHGGRDLLGLPRDSSAGGDAPDRTERSMSLNEPDELTAVDQVARANNRKWLIILGAVVVLIVVALSFFLQILRVNRTVAYANDEQYFKYGSIGSDVEGVPYWIFRVMPDICPKDLPGGYSSLGVI